MGPCLPSRGRRRALAVPLAAALILGAPLAALASWPQFQGGASHEGVSDGPSAPLRVAWTNGNIDLEAPEARGGLSAPVVAADGTIVAVTPAAVLGFSGTDGSETFSAERDFGPSSQPAVADGPDGPVVVFAEGFGDQPPAGTATATQSPSPSPSEDGTFDSHVNAVDLDGRPVWDEPAQLDAIVLMPIAVDEDAAYVGDVGGRVTALDLASGEDRWTADLESQISGAVTLDGDRAYVSALGSTTGTGAVVALDAASGDELWRATEESFHPVSAPVVTDGGIVVLDAGSVVSIDPEGGELNWRTEIVNPLRSPPFLFQGTATPAPVAVDGAVVAVDVTGRGYGLDAETGEIRWDHALNDPSAVSPPVVADGHVLVPADSGTLYALDPGSGHLVWRVRGTDRGFLRGLADAGDVLVGVAGSSDAALIAFGSGGGALLDEPSPTTFDPGELLGGFVLGGVALGAVLVALFRPLQRRLGPALVPADDGGEEDG